MKGFTTIIVLFIIFVLMAVIGILGYDCYFTDKTNKEIKQEKDAINRELSECKKPKPEDKNIYWIGSKAFILENCEMKKVLNINELIQLRKKGYE